MIRPVRRSPHTPRKPTEDNTSASLFDRRSIRVGSLATLVLLLVAPVIFDVDDYPLSTYPMYSSARPAVIDFVTAYGIDDDGNAERLGLDTIGGTDDPLIASGELRAAIRNGQVVGRCIEIAKRIDPLTKIASVEVVTERHNAIDHTLERPSLIGRVVHATCPVTPGP